MYRFRPARSRLLGLAFAANAASGSGLGAQQPTPVGPPGQPSPLPMYRSPVIALAQPASGAPVQQDRPVVVFRFAQGEASDPIDTRSFAVSVDGEDRTALFQVAALEAWGPLAPPRDDGGVAIAPGAHQVAARICSTRGACGTTSATVMLVPPAAGVAEANKPESERRPSLLDRLIEITRKLLLP